MKIRLLIIDPQNDFSDNDTAALRVAGANDDFERTAALIERVGKKLEDIHVTADSHHTMDYRHPCSWKDQHGNHPLPITQGGNLISADDIENDIWIPYGAHTRPSILEGKTVKQFMIECATDRASKGIPGLEVWPEHCVISTFGWLIYTPLREALSQWERQEGACIDVVTKGTNVYTEHYGCMSSEVPLSGDPTTGLNGDFLSILENADMLAVAGQALSHCVMSSVNQIANNIGDAYLKKLYLLTDCTSSVGAVPGGPDFPAIAQAWVDEMVSRGMNVTTSEEFLA